jgi:four helix bundle protein
MTIKSFEDVIAWQKARVLTNDIYAVFGNHSDFGFRDQILRASVSIMNNIAEGFDRGSKKELQQFLVIARGSAAEVRSLLILANDLNYISDERFKEMVLESKDISKLLTGFIKSLATENSQRITTK